MSKGSARTTFVIGALLTLPGASYLAALDKMSKLDVSNAVIVLIVIGFNIVMLTLLEGPLLCFAFAPDWTPGAIEAGKGVAEPPRAEGGRAGADGPRRRPDPQGRDRPAGRLRRAVLVTRRVGGPRRPLSRGCGARPSAALRLRRVDEARDRADNDAGLGCDLRDLPR